MSVITATAADTTYAAMKSTRHDVSYNDEPAIIFFTADATN